MELTRTEIEDQIKNIDLILELYDQLIVFLNEYEEEKINIFDCKEMILRSSDFEDILKEIKSELETI